MERAESPENYQQTHTVPTGHQELATEELPSLTLLGPLTVQSTLAFSHNEHGEPRWSGTEGFFVSWS